MKETEMFTMGYESPLLNDMFFFVKRIQGWEIQLDADQQKVIFTLPQ